MYVLLCSINESLYVRQSFTAKKAALSAFERSKQHALSEDKNTYPFRFFTTLNNLKHNKQLKSWCFVHTRNNDGTIDFFVISEV